MGRPVTTDFAFDDLDPTATSEGATSILETRAPFPSPGTLIRTVADADHEPARIQVFEGNDGIQYWVRDISRFWIEPSGTRVWYCTAPGAVSGDVDHVLAGPILGLAFQLQGQVILHASAVAVGDVAVAFAGPHGAGKSTLAASFVREGHQLVADDKLSVAARPTGFHALRSLPRMKLWEDSLAALDEDADRYEPVLSWGDKRRVTIGRHWGTGAPAELPLAAVYLLAPHRRLGSDITFEPVEPVPASFALLSNMYMAHLLRGQRAAQALDASVRMTTAVPIVRVSYGRAYDGLPVLRAAIIADSHRRRAAQ
jgi:hypothetical protein